MAGVEGNQNAAKEPGTTQDKHIILRVSGDRKGLITRAAVRAKQNLTEYVLQAVEERMRTGK